MSQNDETPRAREPRLLGAPTVRAGGGTARRASVRPRARTMRRDDGASRLASRRASRVALALFACAALVSVVSGERTGSSPSTSASGPTIREASDASASTLRATYEDKLASLERAADTTVARLTRERDELQRNVTRYKRGLLNLEAKRKTEVAELQAQTRELQASLDKALEAALEATREAAATRERRSAADHPERAGPEPERDFRDASRPEPERDFREASRPQPRAFLNLAAAVASTVAAARDALAHRRDAARAFVSDAARSLARRAATAARRRGWLPATLSDDDAEAAASAAIAAAAAAAAIALLSRFAVETIARAVRRRAARSNHPTRVTRTKNGAFACDSRSATTDALGGEDELEIFSPTKAAVDAAARAFDASPGDFELEDEGWEEEGVHVSSEAEAFRANGARPSATTKIADASPRGTSPDVRDGALKSALRRLADALASPATPRTTVPVPEPSPPLDLDALENSDDLLETRDVLEKTRAANPTPRRARARMVSTASPVPPRASPVRGRLAPTPSSRGGRGPPEDALARGLTPGSGDSATSARGDGRGRDAASRRLALTPPESTRDVGTRAGSGPGGRRSAALVSTSYPSGTKPATPRDRMMAYSEKIRKGVVLELPRLRVAEPQDTAVAGGARHARAWET